MMPTTELDVNSNDFQLIVTLFQFMKIFERLNAVRIAVVISQ